MESCVKTDSRGQVLWLKEAGIEIGIALDFGIRIVHLSLEGMENLYYSQPADLSDGFGTPDTWKLRGGHRMWTSPESDDSYHPDDDPVAYTLLPNGVLLEQNTDPILGVKKFLQVTFENGTVRLEHRFQNMTNDPITAASWGINTLDAGGKATMPFPGTGAGDYVPKRVISLWGQTSMADPRLRWEKDALVVQHQAIPGYFKAGFYCSEGTATFESKGQLLTITYDVPALKELPDLGCNFEIFMCPQFIELETLGVTATMAPGESVSHWECWKLKKA